MLRMYWIQNCSHHQRLVTASRCGLALSAAATEAIDGGASAMLQFWIQCILKPFTPTSVGEL